MPRALTRLALNRGGPRDLGALRAGFAAAAGIAVLSRACDADEIGGASMPWRGCRKTRPASQERARDELPLLKRDGNFVRQATVRARRDAGLRDPRGTLSSGWSATLIEETGIRSLKIRHNNVLGYYIEVTANHQAIMTGSDAAKARFIHRQTMASAMRFTTTELAELETKIANAADRALSIELGVFDRLVAEAVGQADAIRAARRRWPCSTSRRRLPAGECENYCRPMVDDSAGLRIEGGPPPGGRAGAAAAGGEAVSSPMMRPVAGQVPATARSGCSPARTWAASRPSCARTR